MLAVALEPDLPLSFTPIKESAEIDAMFRNGEADAFLGMTYIGAKKQQALADLGLRLVSINTWRGFFKVVPQEIRGFAELRGRKRSEEHTSELQSLMRISYAVFCLKKNKKQKTQQQSQIQNEDK